jgi:CheY-like chemotaxis protein
MAYVLIIDDDELLRTILVDVLSTQGISTQQATNGLEGLEKVKQERPAVIVLDEHMPKMNGQQFVEALQKEDWFKEVRIIVYTGLHNSDLAMHKRLAGITDYLDKATAGPQVVAALAQRYLQPAAASPDGQPAPTA